MKKNIEFLLILLVFIPAWAFSQVPSWHLLPNAPVADTITERFDEVYFINVNTGWILQGNNFQVPGSKGKVFRTTNGGNSWDLLNNSLPFYLRSMGFFDENTGLMGTLDSLGILFRTTNGGFNWTPITNIQGTLPPGICGISIVNSNYVYATGRYYGSAAVLKSTDAGLSWLSLNINNMANTLIDCYFWSQDSGIVVGGMHPNPNLLNGNAVILYTANGGLNWSKVYTSSRSDEWCWKINFISRQTGFVSIERGNQPTKILKTINGGLNWNEISVQPAVDLEGIGFINEQTGWVGGWGPFSPNSPPRGPNYVTTNGGVNWSLAGWGINVNRFRFVNDSIGFAVGKYVYKYTTEPIGIHTVSGEIPIVYKLFQNFPNPFNPVTKIKFNIPVSSQVNISVYNVDGKEISVPVNEFLSSGEYEADWDGTNCPSGVYFYKITSGKYSETLKMVLVK